VVADCVPEIPSKGESLLNELRRTLGLLDAWSRRRLVWSTPISVALGVYEALGVFFILPFVQALAQPDTFQDDGASAIAYDWLGAQSDTEYFLRLGSLIVFVFMTRSIASVFFYRWQYRVVMRTEGRLGSRLFARYLAQDYASFLGRNSSVLVRNIHYGVETFVSKVVLPFLHIAVEVVVVAAIGITLTIVQPLATLFAISVLLVASVVYTRLVSPWSRRIATRLMSDFEEGQRWMQESFSSFKSIAVSGNERYFVGQFEKNRSHWGRGRGAQVFVHEMPKYVLELVTIVLVCGTTIVVMVTEPSSAVVATLAVFVAGVFRLLPSLLRTLSAVSLLRFGAPSIDLLSTELEDEAPWPAESWDVEDRMVFAEAVAFDGVSFLHTSSETPSLRDVTVTIERGETIGVVGRSGAGKTTFVDLLLALHQPTTGTIAIDGQPLRQDHVRSWQAGIGYVPQDVVLFDGDLRTNVAFGVEDDWIDDTAVARAVADAQLGEWIKLLPKGLASTVGERGVTVSGGQRQRIGIARALYRDPQLLILDEATAALDVETETAMVETMQQLGGERTVVIVAHRLKTVRHCDRILFFDEGRLVDTGPFLELISRQPAFARLADLTQLEPTAGPSGG
jgi:ATP-binding cassette, subfamily B, bacterial PglK